MEEVIEELAKFTYEFGCPKSYWDWSKVNSKDKAWEIKAAKALLTKLRTLDYLSPQEVKEQVKEARRETIQAVIDWLQGDIDNADKRTAGLPSLKAVEKVVLQTIVNALKEYQAQK